MLQYVVKITYRILRKNRTFFLVNLFGLSTAMACFLYLFLYVEHELSFDKFHSQSKAIYRINVLDNSEIKEAKFAVISPALAPDFYNEYPEVENFARITYPYERYLTTNQETVEIPKVSYVDSSFFNIFDFKLRSGNPTTVLKEPNSIVLSETSRQKLFGDLDPIGQTLLGDNQEELVVTGIMEDIPNNSHIQLSAVISFSTLYDKNLYLDNWDGGWNYYSYLLLNERADAGELQTKFKALFDKKINHSLPEGIEYEGSIENLEDIHFYTEVSFPWPTKGNLQNLIIFSVIGILILILACLNFVNLSTAQAVQRIKEVGVKKTLGLSRKQLILQLLFEPLVIACISLLVSLELVSFFEFLLNTSLNTSVSVDQYSMLKWVGLGSVLILLITLLAGLYPAFYLTHFDPGMILRGQFKSNQVNLLNKGLLTIQIVASVTLISSIIIIQKQLSYLNDKDLGYDLDNTVSIYLPSQPIRDKFEVLKNRLKQSPFVSSVGASTSLPGEDYTSNGYIPESVSKPVMFNAVSVDPDYLAAMGIDLVEGRYFVAGNLIDSTAFIVNRALVDYLGWEEPIGKVIHRNIDHPVIGVVEDYHFASLHVAINPLIIQLKPNYGYYYLSVRLKGDNPSAAVEDLSDRWAQTFPDEAFHYKFLNEYVSKLYGKEEAFQDLFLVFTSLAIVLAAIGLYGLVSQSVQYKLKEIGIRKVFGAGVQHLLYMLSRQYLILFIVANFIGWPLAYIGMADWLDNFAYTIDLNASYFLAASGALLVIIFLTVIIKFLKSVNTNPVTLLKHE